MNVQEGVYEMYEFSLLHLKMQIIFCTSTKITSESLSFKYKFAPACVHRQMLFTSIVRCRFISFSGLVAKCYRCMRVVLSGCKVQAGVFAGTGYRLILKVDFNAWRKTQRHLHREEPLFCPPPLSLHPHTTPEEKKKSC